MALAYARRTRKPLITFPDTDAFICRICETYIALYRHILGRNTPQPDPNIKNQIKAPTVILLHAFNFKSGIREDRYHYEGDAITCRSCLAFLGYRVTIVAGVIFDVDLETGHFELDTTKLYVRRPNGLLRNAETLRIAQIPPAFHYTPDRNFYKCSTCMIHLALDKEAISEYPNIHMYAVFVDIRGMKNVYLGDPIIRQGERRVIVYCSGCCKTLGYMIAEVDAVDPLNDLFRNGRLVMNMMAMDFWCCKKLYRLSELPYAERIKLINPVKQPDVQTLLNAAHTQATASHTMPDAS